MQHTGTLKKRRKRNLSKVSGLSNYPYESTEDNFTGRDLFVDPRRRDVSNTPKKPFSVCTVSDTRLQLSSSVLLQNQRDLNSAKSTISRYSHFSVTSDPNLNAEITVDMEFNDNGTYSELQEYNQTPRDKVNQREHFLDNQTMQLFQQVIFLAMVTGALPWKWNRKTCRIEKYGPMLYKIWWFTWIWGTIINIAIGVYLIHTLLRVVKVAETYRQAFQLCLSGCKAVYALCLRIYLFIYKEPSRQYINTLLKFNNVYVQKYVISLDQVEDGGRGVITSARFTQYAVVVLSTILYLKMAEHPWYLFSIISPKPWYWRLPGAIHEFMLTGQNVTAFVLVAWMIVAHCNTLKFWLSETHNHNDSDNTTDELRCPKTAMKTYRTIQVLQKLFNECISPIGIPMFKITTSMTVIPIGFILVRSMNHIFIDEFPAILYYPFTIFNCTAYVFVTIKMSAEVFDLSCSFVDSWSLTKQKDFRRMLMSCSGLKLWVGSYYFMTISTTVKFLKFIFDYIINCVVSFS